MKLTGLHLLLTYQCNFECDHCFVWGSPWQSGTLTLAGIEEILAQGQQLGTVEWIFFEGGEPFLYYPIMLAGARKAAEMGFKVGIVSNAYWATSLEDALEWLRPFAGLVEDLSVSGDLFHYDETISEQVGNAQAAAEALGIPLGVISIAQPEESDVARVSGQLPKELSGVMYRGRASQELVGRTTERHPWREFTECPYENLRDPGRVHIDPLGNLHICQGIVLGNLFETPLTEIWANYHPDEHPITGPLLAGGPAALVEGYDAPHQESYVDACHLCYTTRKALRERFPEILGPDQMYGVF